MYSPEQQPPPPQHMAPPRMSFSSDFALEQPPPPRPPGRADADFEFSPVGSRPMMAADQLFSKGRILPLREAARGAGSPTTLRDELRAHAADDRGAARRGPRWKELLGLKRAHRKGAASAADAHVDLAGDHAAADAGE
ncbi:uncharacterized protein LOC120677369 [Panicum virgatum]|uniref:Uncharacterized protein n=1 Tax=Panicum virgatum TaxID=38727 RepID=A0A8T0R111_PANVG|nr:uncharacterized protein LOC120677369 [Panicum virgatum]KAG2579337.1 hypothetical protein PVAP13_6NG276703 [Panicum virgatum]